MVILLVMMMIAFITIKSNLVPLIEGLCAQIYFRFEISVVLLTSSSFLFCERKNVLNKDMCNVEQRAKSSVVTSGSARTVTETATAYATVL